MPPRSRRQDIETKECTICVEVRPVYRNFPTFTSCNHPPDTCLTCVSRHAVTQLEANPTWNSCTCAQCNIALPTEELQVVLPRAIFKETNALVARKDMESDEAWRWCLNPSCGYGQLQKPKKTENKVACKKCGFCICFKHQVPWHTGYTCWNYDTSHPESQAVQSSEKVIGDISKACPGPPGGKGCGWRVQKNGGCLHMRCSKCGSHWTWDTIPFDGETAPTSAEYRGGPTFSRPVARGYQAVIAEQMREIDNIWQQILQRPLLPTYPQTMELPLPLPR